MKTCKDLLLIKQIEIIKPKVICTLGAAPLQGLLERPVRITLERGVPMNIYDTVVVPTLHPAYILRNPTKLDIVMHDLLLVKKIAE
jgi:DNA polymerase